MTNERNEGRTPRTLPIRAPHKFGVFEFSDFKHLLDTKVERVYLYEVHIHEVAFLSHMSVDECPIVSTREEEPATWLCAHIRGANEYGILYGGGAQTFQKLVSEIHRAHEPMQSPVAIRHAGGKTTMCFKVRGSFPLSDASLFFVKTPLTRTWYSTFGGWVGSANCARMRAWLMRCAPARANVWAVYQYDSPFWPLLGRRNEVVVYE